MNIFRDGRGRPDYSILVVGAVILAIIGVVYLQIRIIHDCGWVGLMKGSEWLWLFGQCQ